MLIPVFGKDGKIHACRPWEKVCSCGMQKKTVNSEIKWNGRETYLWCYECSHQLDIQEGEF